MIVTIHQPNYLPYLGFFEKVANSDILILYDNTQYKKLDFQNRNKIRTKEGWSWLTLPVSYKFGDLINEVKIADKKALKKHWKTLTTYYANAKYFKNYEDVFSEIFLKNWEKLSDLNIELIKKICEILEINTKIVIASEIIDLKTKSTQALLDMCKKFNADKYIAGKDGKTYMDVKLFEEANIQIIYQDYKHPEYKQVYKGFEPYMCILDLIFNHGPDSLKILMNEKKE